MKDTIDKFYAKSLHRQLLEGEIARCAKRLRGKILDAGSKNRLYDSLFTQAEEIVAVDLKPQESKNIIKADITDLPFEDNSFDAVISFEVLEYLSDIEKALEEIAKVLKRKGLFIFSVPFLNPVHGDVDNMRYTDKALRELLKDFFEIEKIISFGGRYSFMWDLFFEKARNQYGKIKRIVLFPFFSITKKLVLLADRKENNNRFPMGYFLICRLK